MQLQQSEEGVEVEVERIFFHNQLISCNIFPKVKSRSICTVGSFTTKLLSTETSVFGPDVGLSQAGREGKRKVD